MPQDPRSVAFDLELFEWLYTLLLAFAGTATLLGIALLLGALLSQRLRVSRALALLVATVGSAALALSAAAATREPVPLVVHINGNSYASTLLPAAALAVAVLIGIGVAGGLVAAAMWRGARSRGAVPVAALVPLGVLPLATVLLLLALGGLTSEQAKGRHPVGLVTDEVTSSTPVLTGLQLPTGLAVSPDGELFFIELSRAELRAARIDGGRASEPRTVAVLPLSAGAMVLDVLLHPAWGEHPVAFVTVVHGAGTERRLELLRVPTGPGATDAVEVMVAGLPAPAPDGESLEGEHFGGALAACGGYLYLSVGDGDSNGVGPARLAQDPTRPEGKLLRYRLLAADVEPAGIIAADPPIYAMGFRNVFGMTCDLQSGVPVAADNGDEGGDQLRVVPPGSNHEWPLSATRALLGEPLWDSARVSLGVTGLAVRGGPGQRELLLTTFSSGALYGFAVDDALQTAERPRLLLDVPLPVLAVTTDARGCAIVSDLSTIRLLEEPGCWE